jgi:hypothetical protein
MTPEIRNFSDLSLGEFRSHPVWVSVRSFDRGEPWYEGANQESFRPWIDELPFAGQNGIALEQCSLKFKNGMVYPRFVSPAPENWDAPIERSHSGNQPSQQPSPRSRHGCSDLAILGRQQPHIFVGRKMFGFCSG